MLEFSELYQFSNLRNQLRSNTPISKTSGGLYKWWCKKEEFEKLLKRLNSFNCQTGNNIIIDFSTLEKYTEQILNTDNNLEKLYCIYVGQAKGQSLYSRINSQHIGGNPKGSTVRLSFWGLFKGDANIIGKYDSHNESHKRFNKEDINNFINKLYIQVAECDYINIDREEKLEINKSKYIRILNGDDLSLDEEFESIGGNVQLRNAIKENRRYARNN